MFFYLFSGKFRQISKILGPNNRRHVADRSVRRHLDFECLPNTGHVITGRIRSIVSELLTRMTYSCYPVISLFYLCYYISVDLLKSSSSLFTYNNKTIAIHSNMRLAINFSVVILFSIYIIRDSYLFNQYLFLSAA